MNRKAKRKEVAQKSLFKSESAAFTAIAAVLLLGLAFTIISVVKLNYVPEWKIDAEREYSYDAWSSMEDVKTRGDIFTRFMDSDINYPYGLSATVPFSMGGGEIPVFEPSKSNGKLTVDPEGCTMSITFGNHTDDPRTIDCGGITYYSENRQYPDQVFRYENGALILAQGDNSQMKRYPLFNIKEDMGNYTVTINAINITGEPASVSSSTFTALRLTGNSSRVLLNSEDFIEFDGPTYFFNLTIYTQYTDAWTTYLNNTDAWITYLNSTTEKLEYGIDYTINSTDDYVCLSFRPPGNNASYNIHVNEIELCTELAGGVLTGGTTPGGYIGEWYFFEKASGTYRGNPITIDTLLLQDYDSTVVLSSGNSPGEELNPYNPTNEFTYNLQDNSKDLYLNFGFHNNTAFDSAPTSATVRMIYRYEKSDSELPVVRMQFTGVGTEIEITPTENWSLYEETFTLPSSPSPSSLEDIEFTMIVDVANNDQGKLRIDYLTVLLS